MNIATAIAIAPHDPAKAALALVEQADARATCSEMRYVREAYNALEDGITGGQLLATLEPLVAIAGRPAITRPTEFFFASSSEPGRNHRCYRVGYANHWICTCRAANANRGCWHVREATTRFIAAIGHECRHSLPDGFENEPCPQECSGHFIDAATGRCTRCNHQVGSAA